MLVNLLPALLISCHFRAHQDTAPGSIEARGSRRTPGPLSRLNDYFNYCLKQPATPTIRKHECLTKVTTSRALDL
ncbi:hypothetical protein OOU_Y34scaffold00669g97 [Pyricularia oryzae Y34]|uniref:Secreted protein n=1 Tax=Pyricularia oryzae (strain Y34) TaxID=1143189 RepID=A0AA97PIR0_PYRO3|nr:hypothetical protein OOU_Y34scaffold00669g97 [Pyricularia oryzae Y34]